MSTPPPTSRTMCRSPDSVSPANVALATPHSITEDALATDSSMGAFPLDHGDDSPAPRRRIDGKVVHQALRARQAEAEPAGGGKAVLHRPRQVADARPAVFGDHPEPVARPVVEGIQTDLAALGVHQNVA